MWSYGTKYLDTCVNKVYKSVFNQLPGTHSSCLRPLIISSSVAMLFNFLGLHGFGIAKEEKKESVLHVLLTF